MRKKILSPSERLKIKYLRFEYGIPLDDLAYIFNISRTTAYYILKEELTEEEIEKIREEIRDYAINGKNAWKQLHRVQG
jgi:hypothetical protein